MTNELEKQKERLYKHFGVDLSLIPLQRQVRQDIHDILIKLGACKVQTPNCVAISTENGWHKIIIENPISRGGDYKECLMTDGLNLLLLSIGKICFFFLT